MGHGRSGLKCPGDDGPGCASALEDALLGALRHSAFGVRLSRICFAAHTIQVEACMHAFCGLQEIVFGSTGLACICFEAKEITLGEHRPGTHLLRGLSAPLFCQW